MISTTVTVVIACTMYNYIESNCMPPEMWSMPVMTCELVDAPDPYRGCVASAYQASRMGEDLEANLKVCDEL